MIIDNEHMKVIIDETEDGFKVTTDLFGQLTRTFVNVRAGLEDQAARNTLIRMGWTPPERREGDEDMYVESFWRLTADGPVYERVSADSAPLWVQEARRMP